MKKKIQEFASVKIDLSDKRPGEKFNHWEMKGVPVRIDLGLKDLKEKKVTIFRRDLDKKEVVSEKDAIKKVQSIAKDFTKNLIKKADKIIVHTNKNKKDLSKVFKKTPIEVIPHGIIRSKTTHITRKEARKELKISPDAKVLLFFGNIRAYKGLDDLLIALSKLKGDYKLIIAGQCWNNWWRYQKIIDDRKLSDYILRINKFIPEEDVEKLYKASDLMILPYKHFDAQSGVGALSLFFGMPIIVSKIGGLTDLSISKDFIYDVGNVNKLAEIIRGYFDKNKMYTEELNKKKKEFMWDAIIEKTLKFYED